MRWRAPSPRSYRAQIERLEAALEHAGAIIQHCEVRTQAAIAETDELRVLVRRLYLKWSGEPVGTLTWLTLDQREMLAESLYEEGTDG